MGRKQIEIEEELVLDLIAQGRTQKDIALEIGISPLTLSRRLAELKEKQPLLTQYRALQSLQLTELQCRVLEAITPEKIAEASLRDLVLAFKVLKDKELVLDGKPTEIKGLLGYLIQIEKEDAACSSPQPIMTEAEVFDIAPAHQDPDDIDYIPEI